MTLDQSCQNLAEAENGKNGKVAFIAADIIVLAMASSSNGCKTDESMQALTPSGHNTAAFDAQRQGRTIDSDHGEDAFEALTKYATNLTDHARKGKLDPVIGREEEVRRTIQILSIAAKNNPVFIGQPVGRPRLPKASPSGLSIVMCLLRF